MSKSKSSNPYDGFYHEVPEVHYGELPRRAGVFYDNPGLDIQSMIDPKTGVLPVEENRTVQSEKDNCDVNLIVARAVAGGFVDQIFQKPFWGDVDIVGVPDFHTAQNLIAQATERFMALPPKIRARFENDPGQLLAFMDDSRNYEEAVSLGLIPPKQEEPVKDDPAPASRSPAKQGPKGPQKPSEGASGGSEGDAQGSGA